MNTCIHHIMSSSPLPLELVKSLASKLNGKNGILQKSVNNNGWFRSMLWLIMLFKFYITSYTFCVWAPFHLHFL